MCGGGGLGEEGQVGIQLTNSNTKLFKSKYLKQHNKHWWPVMLNGALFGGAKVLTVACEI